MRQARQRLITKFPDAKGAGSLGYFAALDLENATKYLEAAQAYLLRNPQRSLDVRSPEYRELLAKKLEEKLKNPLDAALKSLFSSGSSFVQGVASQGT